jgi:hypothetical protein
MRFRFVRIIPTASSGAGRVKGAPLQNQQRTLVARLARVAARFRGIGRELHTALPRHPSVHRQAPLSHRFSFRLQNSHYVNWPAPGQTLTT